LNQHNEQQDWQLSAEAKALGKRQCACCGRPFMLDRHCPIDRDERIHADNWQDEPTEEDIERQRSIIEAQADLDEMYKYEL
jgi:hypothetical protein